MQKNFAAAFEMVKIILARDLGITYNGQAVIIKHEELRMSVEQRVGFANKQRLL